MSTAWTNFATYGVPTPPGSNYSWNPVDPNSEIQQYWNISGIEPVMATSQKIQDRMLFWDGIMLK